MAHYQPATIRVGVGVEVKLGGRFRVGFRVGVGIRIRVGVGVRISSLSQAPQEEVLCFTETNRTRPRIERHQVRMTLSI